MKKIDALIEVLRKYGVITKSRHALAHGTRSGYFFDIDKAAYSSECVRIVSDMYARKIKEIRRKDPTIDRLVFIEKDYGTVGAITFMSLIVSKTAIDASIVRFRKELPYTDVKGAKIGKTNRCIIVSDVLTSGESVKRASLVIKKYGAETPYAVVLYDREQGGQKILSDLGINLHAILSKRKLVETGDVPAKNPPGVPVDVDFYREEKIIIPNEKRLKQIQKALGVESVEVLKKVYVRRSP